MKLRSVLRMVDWRDWLFLEAEVSCDLSSHCAANQPQLSQLCELVPCKLTNFIFYKSRVAPACGAEFISKTPVDHWNTIGIQGVGEPSNLCKHGNMENLTGSAHLWS